MRVVLLISGGGTTAEAVIKATQSGRLPRVQIVGVISNKTNAGGIKKAQKLKVKTFILDKAQVKDPEKLAKGLLALFRKLKPDLISQNGWLPLTPKAVVSKYEGKIINQHPGPLDPDRADFGGKGMYGARVTCARIAYAWLTGEKNPWTEATTHFVTDKYDQGKIIHVRRMMLSGAKKQIKLADLTKKAKRLEAETAQLQKLLLPLEHENVIETIDMLSINPHLIGITRAQPLILPRFYKFLEQAKEIAIKIFPKS